MDRSKDKAIILTSDQDGKFEYKGLKKGEYTLEEIQAPLGYAKLREAVKFSVDTMTYSKDESDGSHITYETSGNGSKDAQIVTNKKIVIPETGGID